MDSVYMGTLHYDSYESEPLAICTTIEAAKAICQQHYSDVIEDIPLQWKDKEGGSCAEHAYRYTIRQVELDKSLK